MIYFRSHWVDMKFAKKLRATKNPVLVWVSTDALDFVQDVVYAPFDRVRDVKRYITNRWLTKSHMMTSPQLKPGDFYEFEDRLLFCAMDSFVDFCINELGAMHNYENKFVCNKCALLDFFETSKVQQFASSTGDINYKYHSQICEAAIIYNWWTAIRPARVELVDATRNQLVEQFTREEAEDTDMLTRLVNIRSSLWS